MKDTYAEYLVKHKNGVKETLIQLLIVFAAAFVSFISVTFLAAFVGGLSAVVVVGVIYGAYYLVTSLFLEYECIFTNGDLDVDKIICQRKRQRLATVKCENIEVFKRYVPEEHRNKEYQTRIVAVEDEKRSENYCIVANVKGKGKTLVVFTPNDKIIEAIKKFAPKHVVM
jgi:hypothetical protein